MEPAFRPEFYNPLAKGITLGSRLCQNVVAVFADER